MWLLPEPQMAANSSLLLILPPVSQRFHLNLNSSPAPDTCRRSWQVQRRRRGGRSCISAGQRMCSCCPSCRSSPVQSSCSAWCWSRSLRRTGRLAGWRSRSPRIPEGGVILSLKHRSAFGLHVICWMVVDWELFITVPLYLLGVIFEFLLPKVNGRISFLQVWL